MSEVRIAIADSREIVREGISIRLAQDCNADIVGEADTGYSTIKMCRTSEPEILLMDLGLTGPSGKDTFLKLRKMFPDLKIIIISSEEETPDMFFLMSNGAYGCMTKHAKSADFAHTIKSVALGYAVFPRQLFKDFMNVRTNLTRTGNSFGLSPREMEVLKACGSGANTKDVASRLNISVRTVETHRNAIYRKTNCNSLSELPELITNMGIAHA